MSHPEDMYPTFPSLEAVLSIEPPCAYLTNVSEEHVYESSTNWEGKRVAVRLEYPDVRFDGSSHTLWFRWLDYDIPITHGDRVIGFTGLGRGTNGGKEPHELHLFWDLCPAHATAVGGLVASVEWVCSTRPPEWAWWHSEEELEQICEHDPRPRNQRELLEQHGFASDVDPLPSDLSPALPPPRVELPIPPVHYAFPYHPDMELEVTKLVGILSIEPAPENYYSERECVYLYPTAASEQTALWGDAWKYTGPDGEPLAIRLDLPYPQVSLNENSWTLWNGDIGPMTTGDWVIAHPIAPPDFNDNGSDRHKQPHETILGICGNAHATARVVDIQPVEHYCTNQPPDRFRDQCEQAMRLTQDPQGQLTVPPTPSPNNQE